MTRPPEPPPEARDAEPRGEEYVGRRDLTRWDTRLGRLLVGVALWLVDLAERSPLRRVPLLRRWGRWAAAQWVAVLGTVLGLAVAGALAAVAGEIYEAVVEQDGVAGLDRPVLDAALRLRSPGLDHAVTLYTDLGGPVGMPVLVTVVTVVLAVAWRSWTPPVLMVVAAAGSLTMTVAGKALVGRARPPLVDAVPPYETSASFPSGHSLNAVVVAGVVAYLLMRRQTSPAARRSTALLAALFAATMGLSRVFLGHHWLTDVLVAWALGLGWLAVVVTGHRLALTVRRARLP